MRQRRTLHVEEKPDETPARPLVHRFADVDLLPKPREDYQREQTKHGALVSLVTVIVIALLVLWEGIAYARGRDAYDTVVTVDASSSDEMQVNLDVLFPHMQCHRLSVDVIDATGHRHFNYSGNVHKLPCAVGGEPLYKGTAKDLQLSIENNGDANAGECKKCPVNVMRALPESVRTEAQPNCCNTCESVLAVFERAALSPPSIEYVPQCLDKLSERSRGCNVVGSLDLKKVPVTVVLGPRRTGVQYSFKDVLRLDTSHEIKKLRIGNESVQRFSEHSIAEPLTGHKSLSKLYLETRYYIKVVPTTYQTGKARRLNASTYEYSAQWSQRAIVPGINGAVPAMLLSFELSALQVNNIFKRPPVTHFLVQLCGIVGGIFVILGFVDRSVEWAVSHFAL